MSRQSILCRDRVDQCRGNFCRDKVFICCNRASQGMEKLCCEIDNLCRDKVGLDKKFCPHDRTGVRGLGVQRHALGAQRHALGAQLHTLGTQRHSLGAQRHALGAHLTKARTIEKFCRDREFFLATDSSQLFYHDRLLTPMLL